MLGVILAFSQVSVVSASSRKEELKQQKAETQSQLAAQESKIDNLEIKKQALTEEINKLDADLVNVIVEIEGLKNEIINKEAQIEVTKADLVVAEQNRDEQYAAMKKRIQYLYENGGENAWTKMLLQAESIASLLNKAEYVQKMYDSDRTSLDNFKLAVQQVTDLKNQLETEKADLVVMQQELTVQQANLQVQIEQKKATSADYASQIAWAQQQAAEYVQLIREQNAEIRKIEEEEARKAAEEAARKAAEEAARKEAARREEQARKEAEEAAKREEQNRQEAANTQKPSSNTSSSQKPSSTNKPASSQKPSSTDKPASSQKPSASNKPTSSQKPGASEENTGSSSNASGVTGQQIVNYACRFVGYPYIYGGTSLTNGIDCSGFVMRVYEHFGYSLPRSSSEQRSAGRSVSYSQAQPGDIICYYGHVAIYMGGGAIVHASNEKDGIKISSNAAYREIVSVRRIL